MNEPFVNECSVHEGDTLCVMLSLQRSFLNRAMHHTIFFFLVIHFSHKNLTYTDLLCEGKNGSSVTLPRVYGRNKINGDHKSGQVSY